MIFAKLIQYIALVCLFMAVGLSIYAAVIGNDDLSNAWIFGALACLGWFEGLK